MARVSTYGQTLDAQLDQLRAAGCSRRNIYREKVTGARADRRELLRMLDRLAPGDLVTWTRMDRLARSTFDLFGLVERIMDANAQFRSLAESEKFTNRVHGSIRRSVAVIFHNPSYRAWPCRSPIETSPASPIEMSRSSVFLRLVEVAWDDGDHDEPQRAGAPAGADRCC
jgi:Resolvase, N terminal domain